MTYANQSGGSVSVNTSYAFYNQRMYIALVVDSDSTMLFINGLQAFKTTWGIHHLGSTNNYIGGKACPNNGSNFMGFVDEIRIYNDPIDFETIMVIYLFPSLYYNSPFLLNTVSLLKLSPRSFPLL